MTRNASHKRAARVYQRTHPGTPFPAALRAVAHTRTDGALPAAPFGMVATEAFPSITELAREMREKLAADLTAGTGMPSITELAREMREKLAADLTAGTGMPSITELAREMREKLAADLTAGTGMPSATELAREMREKLAGCTRQ